MGSASRQPAFPPVPGADRGPRQVREVRNGTAGACRLRKASGPGAQEEWRAAGLPHLAEPVRIFPVRRGPVPWIAVDWACDRTRLRSTAAQRVDDLDPVAVFQRPLGMAAARDDLAVDFHGHASIFQPFRMQ